MFSLDSLIGNNIVNTILEYLLLIVVVSSYKSMLEDRPQIKNGFLLLWIFMTLFSMFYSPLAGDSVSSLDSYNEYKAGTDSEMLHFEPVYFAIMSLVQNGYVMWRFIVWGAASIIVIMILKKQGCDERNCFFLWAYLGMQAFYYQRIALAMGIMFLGIVQLINIGDEVARRKTYRIVLAIVLVGLSTFFHRSMPIYIVVSALVLLMPTKKWSMILLLVGIPIVLPLIVRQTGVILGNASEDYQIMGDIYLDASRTREQGIKGTIFQLFKWTPYAIMILYCVWDLLKRPESYSKIERYFLLFAAVLYMLSFMFTGLVADSVGGKMKVQSVMSMTMFLCLYYTSHKGSKQCNLYAKAALMTFLVIFFYEHFL